MYIRLHESLFAPLLSAIRDCKHLFLTPDGAINRVPFDLVAPNGYVFHYLTTGRDLLRFTIDTGAPGGPPLVIADPDFDSGSSDLAPVPPKDSFHSDADRLRCDTLRFSRLPGALAEGTDVAARLGVNPVVAEAATETVLRNVSAPTVLHIATHGYYFPKPKEAKATLFLPERLSLGEQSEHPLMRSGLVFAGVNRVLDGGSAPDSPHDGIINALDVAGLPLHGTRIVVLSCCFSGRGDVENGEGVAGLRRSFIIAGAQAVVCSLWAVPDRATRALMVIFYDALKTGLGAGVALQTARTSLREQGYPPNAWAAFVCVGNQNATL